MENTKDVIKEFESNLARFQQDWPKQRAAFAAVSEVTKSPGALDSKYKYLIAVGIAVNAHCHWCIAGITEQLRKKSWKQAGWQFKWVVDHL